jgi:hypothetical protein
MMNPFLAINANGDGVTRAVTLALPRDTVRNLLPAGLELGEQSVTDSGLHPVVLFFHDLYGAGFSLPSFFPKQTYREFSMGVPYTYLSRGFITAGHPGPYYYMPKLYLDNPWPALTGLIGWGFAKRLAAIHVTDDRYTISNSSGRLTSLSWKTDSSAYYKPIAAYSYFTAIRTMLEQPLISMVPMGMGPFFVVSNFERHWDVAQLRPLQTVVDVDFDFVTGYPAGRYPASDWSAGIDKSVLGSYELRAPWRLSLPYHPLLSFGRPGTALTR